MIRYFVALLMTSLFPIHINADEPISLFDGETLDGWVTMDDKPVVKDWEVVNGTIHLKVGDERAGDIKTTELFEKFELEFEWRIAQGGNSGVKYLAKYAQSDLGAKYFGCEYQLLDDQGHKNGRDPLKTAGSLYGLYAPDLKRKQLHSIDQFNHSKIVVEHGKIEHWLNGKRIVEATIGSDDWEQNVKRSKVNSVQDFAHGPGVILLQEHLSEVWFRNIRIKRLGELEVP